MTAPIAPTRGRAVIDPIRPGCVSSSHRDAGLASMRPPAGGTCLVRLAAMYPAAIPVMLSMDDYRILESDGQVESRRPRNPGQVAGTPLLIVRAMAQFMVVLDFTIVNVALPSIQASLHIGTSTLQWLISGYAVSFGGFLLLGGRLADLFGQARMFRIRHAD